MAIKRYLPKFKKLAKFYKPLWLEKRVKIRKFEKQKWKRVKKLYFPRRVKFYRQDVSAYAATRGYDSDRSIRLKKTYKFLLKDKQRFQLYYGVGKFRFFQLKNMAKKIRHRVTTRNLTSSNAMLSLVEDRLDTVLYRLMVASSIPQARKLIQDGRVKVGLVVIKNSNYMMRPNDVISFDPLVKHLLFGIHLKNYMPYFFFRYKKKRRHYIKQRKSVWEKSVLTVSSILSLVFMKSFVSKLKKNI